MLLALPLVSVLWVTLGLPILTDVTSATASNRRDRSVFVDGTGSPNGGSKGSDAAATVSLASFSPAVVRSIAEHRAAKAHHRRAPLRPRRTRTHTTHRHGSNPLSEGPLTPAIAPLDASQLARDLTASASSSASTSPHLRLHLPLRLRLHHLLLRHLRPRLLPHRPLRLRRSRSATRRTAPPSPRAPSSGSRSR